MTVINSNINALKAQSSLTANQRSLDTAMTRLSTGLRINSAKDDAAGLAISQRMTADIKGLAVAIRNANDGISLAQTAETALGEVSNMLQRMRELSVQAANGTLSSANRQSLQKEMTQLVTEVDNVSKTANFNGIKLLDGTNSVLTLQTGTREGEKVTVNLDKTDSLTLGLQGFAIEGQLTSGRVGNIALIDVDKGDHVSPDPEDVDFDNASGDAANDAVLINGKAFTTVDGMTDVTTATADYAKELADAINLNVGEHRVTASAYNTVKGVAPTRQVFADGDLAINGVDVKAASSVDELVANINRDVGGILAVKNADGTITLSNDTGEDIEIGGTNSSYAGFDNEGGLDADGVYSGFVVLKSMDNNPITMSTKNKANGYENDIGNGQDLRYMGFNESSSASNLTGEQVLWYGQDDAKGDYGKLTLEDNVFINGERVGVSQDGSAASKATAINSIADKTGVTAQAVTKVRVTLDVSADNIDSTDASDIATTFAINGTAVDLHDYDGEGTTAINLADMVKAINRAGIQGVVASSEDGDLILTSDTGLNISVYDGGGALVTAARSYFGEDSFDTSPDMSPDADGTFSDGFEVDAATGTPDNRVNSFDYTGAGANDQMVGVTFGGRITLSSSTGAAIQVSGDYLSLEKVGLTEQGGSGDSIGGAITITTQASAEKAITAVDQAIDKVNLQRADLGAIQSRLEVAVNNLTSTSSNMTAARSRIMDTDYSAETTQLSRAQIIQQASMAMLAQANQQPQMVLSLLK